MKGTKLVILVLLAFGFSFISGPHDRGLDSGSHWFTENCSKFESCRIFVHLDYAPRQQIFFQCPGWNCAHLCILNLTSAFPQVALALCQPSLVFIPKWVNVNQGNLRRGIGPLYHPCVNVMSSGYAVVMWGAIIIMRVWFSPRREGNSRLLGSLIYNKIQRHNNHAPYMTPRWLL